MNELKKYEELKNKLHDAVNELCVLCGKYQLEHILPSKESRKKVQEAFNIVVKYGFCSDCVQKYDGTLCHQCDCFQNGVDVIRQALFESEDL